MQRTIILGGSLLVAVMAVIGLALFMRDRGGLEEISTAELVDDINNREVIAIHHRNQELEITMAGDDDASRVVVLQTDIQDIPAYLEVQGADPVNLAAIAFSYTTEEEAVSFGPYYAIGALLFLMVVISGTVLLARARAKRAAPIA